MTVSVALTDKELTELTYLHYLGFKYIARHEIGAVCVFKKEPVRNKVANNITQSYYDTWVIGSYPIRDFSQLDDVKLGDYDFITWENGVWLMDELIQSTKRAMTKEVV